MSKTKTPLNIKFKPQRLQFLLVEANMEQTGFKKEARIQPTALSSLPDRQAALSSTSTVKILNSLRSKVKTKLASNNLFNFVDLQIHSEYRGNLNQPFHGKHQHEKYQRPMPRQQVAKREAQQ